jgi:Flp pilus assembly protein TadG
MACQNHNSRHRPAIVREGPTLGANHSTPSMAQGGRFGSLRRAMTPRMVCKGCVQMKAAILAKVKTFLRGVAVDIFGTTTIQFAIAVPLFTVLVIGIAQGGLLLFDEIELTNATAVGLRTFAVARQPSCRGCTATPYTSAINAVANSGRLQLGTSNVTLVVGSPSNPPCTTDTSCLAALNAAHTSGVYFSPASITTVSVTYPCPRLLPASWMALVGICAPDARRSADVLTVAMSQPVE